MQDSNGLCCIGGVDVSRRTCSQRQPVIHAPANYAHHQALGLSAFQQAHRIPLVCLLRSKARSECSLLLIWTCESFLTFLSKAHLLGFRSPQAQLSSCLRGGLLQVRLTTTVILAVIFGSVFWQKGMERSTTQGVNRIAAMQFLAVINLGFNNAFTVQPILAVERGVFYRERAAYYYNSISYGLAQGDVEIPFLIVQVTAWAPCTWTALRLRFRLWGWRMGPWASFVSLSFVNLRSCTLLM